MVSRGNARGLGGWVPPHPIPSRGARPVAPAHARVISDPREAWLLTSSREKTRWGREGPGRRGRSGGWAGGRRCLFLRYWPFCSRLSEVFCPVSRSSWTQVVTTIARLPSFLTSSSSSLLGVPTVFQPFIYFLNGLRRSLQKRNHLLCHKSQLA